MTQQPDHAGGCILVAENDPDIRELILAQLSTVAPQLESAGTLAEVRAIMEATPVDLLVLDLNLPDGDGINLCRQLRSDDYDGAIIMVTARDAALDRVLGLEFGADDYLTKPFEPRELVARVRSLLRRVRNASASSGRPRNTRFARFGPWKLDLYQRRLVGLDDRLVMLSTAEFEALDRFVDAPNQVMSREELLPERGATISIDMRINRLRQKLATEPGGADVILTVRRERYVMPGPVTFE